MAHSRLLPVPAGKPVQNPQDARMQCARLLIERFYEKATMISGERRKLIVMSDKTLIKLTRNQKRSVLKCILIHLYFFSGQFLLDFKKGAESIFAFSDSEPPRNPNCASTRIFGIFVESTTCLWKAEMFLNKIATNRQLRSKPAGGDKSGRGVWGRGRGWSRKACGGAGAS